MRYTKATCVTSLAIALLLGTSLSVAEIPGRPQSELDRAAKILNGVVTSIADEKGVVDGCRHRHEVSISVREKEGEAPKLARGFYVVWDCPKRPQDKAEASERLQPPGHYETRGIRSLKVGDRVKIYADSTGDIYEPNGIQLQNK